MSPEFAKNLSEKKKGSWVQGSGSDEQQNNQAFNTVSTYLSTVHFQNPSFLLYSAWFLSVVILSDSVAEPGDQEHNVQNLAISEKHLIENSLERESVVAMVLTVHTTTSASSQD